MNTDLKILFLDPDPVGQLLLFEGSLHCVEEGLFVKGFDDVVIGACLDAGLGRVDRRCTRDHDHGNVMPLDCFDLSKELNAIHLFHPNVRNNRVKGMGVKLLKGLGGLSDCPNIVPFKGESLLDGPPDGLLIVHHQDPFRIPSIIRHRYAPSHHRPAVRQWPWRTLPARFRIAYGRRAAGRCCS